MTSFAFTVLKNRGKQIERKKSHLCTSSYIEWKPPKGMKTALLIRETNFTFFSWGGGGKVVICSLTKSSSISTSDSLEKALNKYLSTQRSPLCILSHVWLQHWGAQSLGKGSRKHPPHPPSGEVCQSVPAGPKEKSKQVQFVVLLNLKEFKIRPY